jgi:hypothetical protein
VLIRFRLVLHSISDRHSATLDPPIRIGRIIAFATLLVSKQLILIAFLALFQLVATTEKHKTFHFKDDQLAKEGFKKYHKNDVCCIDCPLSGSTSHIHCVKTGKPLFALSLTRS